MMMMMMTYRRPLCVLFQLFTVLEVPIEPPTHVEQHARHIKPTQVEVRSCKKQQRERFSASRQHPLSVVWRRPRIGPFRCCCCGQPAKPNAWLRATTSVTFNPLIIFLAPAQHYRRTMHSLFSIIALILSLRQLPSPDLFSDRPNGTFLGVIHPCQEISF